MLFLCCARYWYSCLSLGHDPIRRRAVDRAISTGSYFDSSSAFFCLASLLFCAGYPSLLPPTLTFFRLSCAIIPIFSPPLPLTPQPYLNYTRALLIVSLDLQTMVAEMMPEFLPSYDGNLRIEVVETSRFVGVRGQVRLLNFDFHSCAFFFLSWSMQSETTPLLLARYQTHVPPDSQTSHSNFAPSAVTSDWHNENDLRMDGLASHCEFRCSADKVVLDIEFAWISALVLGLFVWVALILLRGHRQAP